MPEPINLIEKALQFAREARIEFETSNLGIREPLYPKARREHLYLRMREYINVGCRRAVKLLPETWKRSIAYSILMQACIDIFHYKKTDTLLAVYNKILDQLIGTH